jgi:hypothetical protein
VEARHKPRRSYVALWKLATPGPLFVLYLFVCGISALISLEAAATVAMYTAVISTLAVIRVTFRLSPSTPLRETSALFARLSWLGRFVLGGTILFLSAFLAITLQFTYDSADSPHAGISAVWAAIPSLIGYLVLTGVIVATVLLLGDLSRAGMAGRRQAAVQNLESWMPNWARRLIGDTTSAITDPRLVLAFAVLGAIGVFGIADK